MTTTITKQVLLTIDKMYDSPEKWCQGPAHDGKGGVCLFFGAIGTARRKLGLRCGSPSETPEYKLLHRLTPWYLKGIRYNDSRWTTFEDVKALLARAIKEA